MIYEIYDMVLMMPRCGIMMLINIYVLYDDSHEGFHPSFIGFHPCFTVMVT